MNEIVATVADALVYTRDDLTGFLPLTASALLLRQLGLCFCQCLFFFAEEAGVLDVLAVAADQVVTLRRGAGK